MLTLLSSLSLSLSGCIPAPCAESCSDFSAFFAACADPDGMLCDGTVTADCVDDPETFSECQESGFEGSSCDYDTLQEEGVVHPCESSSQAHASCVSSTKFDYAALTTKAEREAFVDGCGEQSEFSAAIAAKDCASVCSMLGAK